MSRETIPRGVVTSRPVPPVSERYPVTITATERPTMTQPAPITLTATLPHGITLTVPMSKHWAAQYPDGIPAPSQGRWVDDAMADAIAAVMESVSEWTSSNRDGIAVTLRDDLHDLWDFTVAVRTPATNDLVDGQGFDEPWGPGTDLRPYLQEIAAAGEEAKAAEVRRRTEEKARAEARAMLAAVAPELHQDRARKAEATAMAEELAQDRKGASVFAAHAEAAAMGVWVHEAKPAPETFADRFDALLAEYGVTGSVSSVKLMTRGAGGPMFAVVKSREYLSRNQGNSGHVDHVFTLELAASEDDGSF